MRTQIWNRLAILVLILVAALLASPGGRVNAQIMGDLPTNWVFTPAGVTNLQAVRLTYANTLSVPVIVSMAILGGKVNGATWTPKVLASQQNVVVSPGQGTVLVLDWNAAGGLAAGERAQVFGQMTVSAVDPKTDPVASLEISDLLGLAIPEIVEPKSDPGVDPKGDPITQDFHFNPVIVTNRHVVRLSFMNTDPAPVRITTAILGGKMAGATWNAGTFLAGQKDLLVGPGQGTLLTLDWNAIGGLANNDRAQVYGRIRINGVTAPRDIRASFQIHDVLGLLPVRVIHGLIDPKNDPAR